MHRHRTLLLIDRTFLLLWSLSSPISVAFAPAASKQQYPEPIKKHEHYVGRRIKRGLFRSQFGMLINADVNGSLNMIKKVAPKSFEGVEDVVVHPVPLAVGA